MVRITTIDFPDGSIAAMLGARRPAMEMNAYILDRLVREKLDEARALSARHALVRVSRPPGSMLRARLGAALITIGERLAGVPAPRPSCVTPGQSGRASRGERGAGWGG